MYDAIENGVADLADPMLKDRIAELKATRDQARAEAERAEGALERLGPSFKCVLSAIYYNENQLVPQGGPSILKG